MASGIRRSEDLGGMGESYFRLLAKDAGLVANSSSDDKAGWDFEVEESNPLVINYTNQSRSVYRVQVKATMSANFSVAMSFSSLLSLIQYGGPAFVFFIRFGESLFPQAAYIAHIDEKRTLEILTALRKKEVSNKSLQLNKVKFSLRFDPLLSPLITTGAELRRSLEGSLGGSPLNYINSKMKWLRKIEEDSTLWRANMRFESEESFRTMVDCLLGYETPFNVTSVMFKAPLGIPDQEPIHPAEFSPATVKPIIQELPRALVRLRTSPYGSIYEFKATVYSVPVNFPKKFAAIRIHTALFDIVYRYQGQAVEFKVADLCDDKLRASIGELRGFIRYMGEVFESDNTLFEIQMDNDAESLKLSVETRASVPPDDYQEVSEAAEALFLKLTALGLSNEQMRPADIFDKRCRIGFLQHVGNTYEPPFSFEFYTDDEICIGAEVTVFNSPIKLEGKTIVCFAAFYGSVKKLGAGRLHGTFLRSEYLGEIVVSTDADLDHVQKLYGEKFQDALRKRGLVVL